MVPNILFAAIESHNILLLYQYCWPVSSSSTDCDISSRFFLNGKLSWEVCCSGVCDVNRQHIELFVETIHGWFARTARTVTGYSYTNWAMRRFTSSRASEKRRPSSICCSNFEILLFLYVGFYVGQCWRKLTIDKRKRFHGSITFSATRLLMHAHCFRSCCFAIWCWLCRSIDNE